MVDVFGLLIAQTPLMHKSDHRSFFIPYQVQLLAVAGMVAYLATYKTVTELGAIAAVYTKNSDILAAR